MNGREIAAVLAAIVVMAGAAQPAMAQSPLDGPLSSPGAMPSPAPTTHAKAKPRKAHHANAKPVASPDATAAPRATPADAPVASHAAPADPLDLGMKWQGSSDGSAQTKFQSGPNTSAGSGAEVGMKLHF